MSISISPIDVEYITCNGGTNGSITISPSGGTATYTFQWFRNGVPYATTQNIYYINAAFYDVIVTDSLGATYDTRTNNTTIEMLQGTPIMLTLEIGTPVVCIGGTGLIASIDPVGGTPPYTYLWNNAATTASITVIAGTYTLVATDDNGCTGTATITLPDADPVILEIERTDVSGQVILTAEYSCSGGTVLWNTGATTASIIGTAGNTYVVTLTCGSCTATASISVGDQDNSYWCCLSSVLNNRILDEFNGVQPCDCDDDLVLICLIPIFETINDGCLSSKEQTAIISKLNEICCCGC